MNPEINEPTSWLEKPISAWLPFLNVRNIIIAVILILAVVSRIYNVDLRVMSHDEVNHVVPSFDLFSGRGYRHDPVTHGPMQFHLVALSYFLLGDNDFSSRLPSVLFSICNIRVPPLSRQEWGFNRGFSILNFTVHAVLWKIYPQRIVRGLIRGGDDLRHPELP
jgi:predicted membrane-bound mannosyltransferase